MRLTTKGRYAVTAMLDLALYGGEHPVALSDIAQRQAISQSYLEQLFSRLRRKGLVASTRGPGGGYRLVGDTDQIAVVDIIHAVDEPVDTTQCANQGNCAQGRQCLTHDLWADLNAHIHDFLSQVTLQQLVSDARQKMGTRLQVTDTLLRIPV